MLTVTVWCYRLDFAKECIASCQLLLMLLLLQEACLQVAPIMFLYLQHRHKPLPAAAHTLFCAVIKQTDQVQLLLACLH